MGHEGNPLIGVFLDHNVWHLFFALGLDLAVELPSNEFGIGITREAEFEIAATTAADPVLKAYIDKTIARCRIATDSYFGFFNESLPQDEQRVGGWAVGRWASARELEFIAGQRRWHRKAKRKTKLYKHEADISLAARSFATSCVVLTCDKKAGPLRDAYEQGGNVVYLNDFPTSGLSLRSYIEKGDCRDSAADRIPAATASLAGTYLDPVADGAGVQVSRPIWVSVLHPLSYTV